MGGLGTIITIIFVVAWVVKGLASVTGNQKDDGDKPRKHRSLEEWDEVQAERREEMADRQEALSQMRAEATSDPSQMTMAERIELARQRARQQAGLSGQDDGRAEALHRARAEQQAQAQRQQVQQQRAQQERAAQQRAARERERVQQQRRQRQQAEQQAQAQQRAKQKRRSKSTRPSGVTTGSKREGVVAQSMQRVHQGHGHAGPAVVKSAGVGSASVSAASIGALDRNSLRKAFIMKELLDKPVALRDPQAGLLS